MGCRFPSEYWKICALLFLWILKLFCENVKYFRQNWDIYWQDIERKVNAKSCIFQSRYFNLLKSKIYRKDGMRLDMLLNSPFYFADFFLTGEVKSVCTQKILKERICFSQSSLQDFALLVSLNGPEKSYLFLDQSEVI